MNILVVDDNPTNRKLLRVTLEAEGLNIVEASDGVQALAALDRHHVDAIISDILMPRMDGYRLCYEVRASKRFHQLPFIVYTNTFDSQGDEKAALEMGADKFLRKPAQVKQIAGTLDELIKTPPPGRRRLVAAPHQLELMKEYSEVLVKKLTEKNEELQLAAGQLTQMNEVLSRQTLELTRAKDKLLNTNLELELRVRERTAQLETANRELEAFSHSVAHDLRAPLRAIDGYSQIVMQEFSAGLGPEAIQHLGRISESARHMSQFIEGLLNLAHVGFHEIVRRPVNLSELAGEIAAGLHRSQPERRVKFVIAADLTARCDKVLLRAALENLLGNAWKFTGKSECPRIEFGVQRDGAATVYFVRDSGAGFDMAYADKLFSPFQRLHSEAEFPGTGVGLATVGRIIQRHGGVVRAESAVGTGATFYFTLDRGDE